MADPEALQPAAARGLAVVTGASSGIGLELARCAAAQGFDLVLAADEPLEAVTAELADRGVEVTPVHADLATAEGVAAVCDAVAGRPVKLLAANAGHGLGAAFLDQDFDAVRHLVDTNVTGTLALLHRLGRRLREQGRGRILVTGSIAGLMPGGFHAAYNASKAFVDSFAYALREELKGSGVTVTVLMPGATDTAFFTRAGLEDTKLGTAAKDDAADVARAGLEAALAGQARVITGARNKVQAMAARVVPDAALAHLHAGLARPGSARARRPARTALLGGAALLALLWWRAAGRGARGA